MATGKEKGREKVFKKKGKGKEIENNIAKGTNSRGQCWPATIPSSSVQKRNSCKGGGRCGQLYKNGINGSLKNYP